MMFGPDPPEDFIDNGCGPKTALGLLKLLVPNGIKRFLIGRRLDWRLACRYHDWHWVLAEEHMMTYASADRFLYLNMRELIESQGAPRRARIYPAIYWAFVRVASIWKLRPWK
jgi:hypothetical protein